MIELAFFAAGFTACYFRSDIFKLAKEGWEKIKQWRADRAAAKAAK